MPKKPALVIPLSSSIRDIRYLSFQGGGMKGIGDVGALEVLEEQGVLSQIEAVAGSSVGGIMAMLVAIGYTSEEIKQEMLHLDFKALQDKATPGWIESMHLHEITPVNPFGSFETVEDLAKLVLGSSWGLFEGDRLCAVLSQMLAKKGFSPHLTFSELASLAAMPGSAQKNIILTGTNLSDHTTEYYSAEKTPDMSIIEAVRISASFPGAFKPVRKMETIIEGGVEKRVEKIRVDGGFLENLPDVFNQPPYFHASELGQGNPQALALSFQASKSKKKSKRGIGLFQSLYETGFSEDRFKKKYGLNVVNIKTLGMGTLEFDASPDKKQALVDSGRDAVYETFEKILQTEDDLDARSEKDGYRSFFEAMPLDRLLRMEVALAIEMENIPLSADQNQGALLLRAQQKLIMVKKTIFEKAPTFRDGALKESDLEAIREKARHFFEKIEGAQRKDRHPLSQEVLIGLCRDKKQQLSHLRSEIEERFDRLHIARQSLIDYSNTLKENIIKEDFSADLSEIRGLCAARDHGFLEGDLSDESHEKHKQSIDNCLRKKITKYRDRNDRLSAYFFENLLETSPDFTVPLDSKMIDEMLQPDIDRCDELIRLCELGMAYNVKEKHVFERKILSLEERNDRGNHYEALLAFNMELDTHIYNKTNFLLKLNNFFIEKSPMLAVLTQPFFECVSMAAFVVSLPLAIPALSVAKAIGHFSSNDRLKAIAKKTERLFSYKSLKHNIRLKEIQNETKKFTQCIKDNYDQSDHSEISYLFKLHALYLKGSGINFEDIVERKPEESLDAYKTRLKKLKSQFELLPHRDRAIANIGFDHPTISLNEGLRAEVIKQMAGVKPEDIDKIHAIQKQGIDPCELEFFYDIREKMAEGGILSTQEQSDFMALAPKFERQYPCLYREFERAYSENLVILRSPTQTVNRKRLFEGAEHDYREEGLQYFKRAKVKHQQASQHGPVTDTTSHTRRSPQGQAPHTKSLKPKPNKS